MDENRIPITFEVYVKGRETSLKRIHNFLPEFITQDTLQNTAKEIAKGFFHSFNEKLHAFISPSVIEEVHWEYEDAGN